MCVCVCMHTNSTEEKHVCLSVCLSVSVCLSELHIGHGSTDRQTDKLALIRRRVFAPICIVRIIIVIHSTSVFFALHPVSTHKRRERERERRREQPGPLSSLSGSFMKFI